MLRSPWLDLPWALCLAWLVARALRGALTRRDAPGVTLSALGTWVVARAAGASVPLHFDTLRDLLAARDCVEAGACHAEGPRASVGAWRHGTAWLRLPEYAARLHGDERALRLLVELTLSLSAVLVFAAVVCANRRRDAAAVAASVGALSVVACGHPVLWHPSWAPCSLALAVLLCVRALGDGDGMRAWLAAGVAVGLAIDAHPAALAWAPCVLAAAAWRGDRDGLAAAALGVCVGVALPSPVAVASAALDAAPRVWLAVLAAACGASAVGVALRRARVATVDGVALLFVSTGVASLFLARVAGAGEVAPRYLLPLLPWLGVGLSAWSSRAPRVAVMAVGAAVWGFALAHRGTAAMGLDVARAMLDDPSVRGLGWTQLATRLEGDETSLLRMVAAWRAPLRAAGDELREALRVRVAAGVPTVRRAPSVWSWRAVRVCVDEHCTTTSPGATEGATFPFSERVLRGIVTLPAHDATVSVIARVVPPRNPVRVRVAAGDAWTLNAFSGRCAVAREGDGVWVVRPETGDDCEGRFDATRAALAARRRPVWIPEVIEDPL